MVRRMRILVALLVVSLSVFQAKAELFEITLIGNEVDSALHLPGGTFPEQGNPWFSDLTGDGNSDITLSDVQITIGDHGGEVSDPPDMFFGIVFDLNGERNMGTEIDGAALFNEGFDENTVMATTYRAVTFTPPGEASSVTGLLEITVDSSSNGGGNPNFRTIAFTRILWDDTRTITTLPNETPTIYGTTAEVNGASVFTKALVGLYQIILLENIFAMATTPDGRHAEADQPWFSDFTGDGLSDIVLTDARFFDDGTFKSIDFKVNGVTVDTSIEFDFVSEGLIVKRGFEDESAEESVGYLPVTFTPEGFQSAVDGLLEMTVRGNPSRSIAFTRVVWDTRSAVTSLPSATPQLYGFTYEVGGTSIFSPPPMDWDADVDQDGTPFAEEFALGTHPFIADPLAAENPTIVAVGMSEVAVEFGTNPLAKPYLVWSLKRSTDLKAFDSVYTFNGTTGQETLASGVGAQDSSLSVTITDPMGMAGQIFYTLDASR